MQCEFYALEGIAQLVGTIERVKATRNPKLAIEGVLLTMFDPRSVLARQVADELRKHFRVFDTVVPRNVRLSEAPSFGKPVLLYDVSSKGCQAYLAFAKELMSKSSVHPPQRPCTLMSADKNDKGCKAVGDKEGAPPRPRPRSPTRCCP